MTEEVKDTEKNKVSSKIKQAPAVVLVSGGPDSAVLATYTAQQRPVVGLYISFGQVNSTKEAQAAERVFRFHGLRLETIDARDTFRLFYGTPAYGISPEIVRGLYGVGLCLACSYAAAISASHVYVGILKDDLISHPELGINGLNTFTKAMETVLGERVEIEAPFLSYTKSEVFNLGQNLNVPFEFTWSCLRDGEAHCGECKSCLRRTTAFQASKIEDKTSYLTKPKAQRLHHP